MRIVRFGEEAGECWMAKSSASLVVKVDHLGEKDNSQRREASAAS
jgi:hypothetical protein